MYASLNNTSLDSTVSSQTIINKDGIAIYTDSLIPAEKSDEFISTIESFAKVNV